MRNSTITRKTNETDISLSLAVDGSGKCEANTGIGFFDHMLTSLCRFAMIDLSVTCAGDLNVDGHHTVEDVGICLGQAICAAVDKAGIRRSGSCYFPMDDALAFAAIDVSGRSYLRFDALLPEMPSFDTRLIKEFFRAVSQNAGLTLHLSVSGENAHHMSEALFKAFGRALEDAVRIDPRILGVLSTKGIL